MQNMQPADDSDNYSSVKQSSPDLNKPTDDYEDEFEDAQVSYLLTSNYSTKQPQNNAYDEDSSNDGNEYTKKDSMINSVKDIGGNILPKCDMII